MKRPQKIGSARELGREQTEAELILWSYLRNMQVDGTKFRRQHPIGNYIVDFVSLDKKLVIEVDGGQHNDELGMRNDETRTKWLEHEGFHVIRFCNNDITSNLEGVMIRIRGNLDGMSPSP